MARSQEGILAPLPKFARFTTFQLVSGADPAAALIALKKEPLGARVVVGIGHACAARLGRGVPGLHELEALSGPSVTVPSTPAALWCFLRGDVDPGELLLRERELAARVSPAFEIESATTAFKFGEGRDLSGYMDGTENPKGDDALEAAFVRDAGPHLDGGSFVAAQRWRHDLGALARRPARERDLVVGRRIADNTEIADAPESAHVKRTAQESFAPEAFVLRRSMPWAEGERAGLVFVAFGCSLRAFEVQLRRMAGLEDGITDALFSFTRPETGAAFFCPPIDDDGRLDLGALGI